mmetsp:Transcript_41327/g.46980  ORF Transcript_41327/g.46980 Transcript_41327/m.46980 type:complete len:176 (-) Transcript_41327:118-645(-)|eukprot:CAMPEP_0194131914 /NCGR_PEP_ID=MMETSP0152-20130528/2536_1 /TAXON_ID=1049557 /ORGANISM="Thalassiothrix antarctica, Strain L6-D1" /LENGTH=175 /DNA_ID=CAMNT_0038826809 /DNA_START=16 /DNA_END=543 /DNA_ORIENTATION=+
MRSKGLATILLLASRFQQVAAFQSTSLLFSASTRGTNHLYAAKLEPERLCSLAKDFLRNKNAAGRGDTNLDPVFEMCSPDVDLYGLKGDNVRPGFISFFQKYERLHHELIDEPVVVGPTTVQYSFIKTWIDGNEEEKVWKSIDPEKPRNKVERLSFNEEGMLITVSVVEADDVLN